MNGRVLRGVESVEKIQRDPLNSVDSTFNGHILTYLGYHLFYNDFLVPILSYGQLDHIQFKNRGFVTLGSFLRDPGPKNLK